MANTITLSRLILLALAAILLYQPSATARIIAAALIVLTIILDGVDGWIARAWDEVSDLGSVCQIRDVSAQGVSAIVQSESRP